ncbi:major facilitator superfamily domain-containing protein 6-like [Asterias amurensis]|uniref:major facilitator superfamily domain-containing protein 6-like n=1 Tax=Asterias amurensis TaxID=7602 RepID=UPI003AB1F45C
MKLDMHVNCVLLPFKAIYFFVLAGMSCILPFLPVYMHQLGLSVVETGLIRSLEPLVSFLASPVWGSVADKFSKHKLILVVSLIGSELLTFAIIFVPSTDTSFVHHNEKSTNESWTWSLNCSLPDWTTSSLCCDSDQPECSRSEICADFCNATRIMSSTTELPLYSKPDSYLYCSLCMPSKVLKTAPTLNATLQRTDDKLSPTLRVNCLQDDALQKTPKANFSCFQETSEDPMCVSSLNQTVLGYLNGCNEWTQCTCANVTTASELPSDDGHVSNSTVFILFIILVLSSKVFLCNVFPLLDSSLMLTLRDRPQDYGKQRLWGAIGWGSFALVSGFTIDAISVNSTTANYNPAFYLFLGLTTVSVVSAAFMPNPPHKANKKMLKNFCGLLMQSNIITFIFVVFVAGMSFGINGTFLFLFLEELNSPHILMGMTLTVSSLSEVFFLFYAGPIIKKITCIGVAYLTLLCYAVRFLGYSLISNPWLVLPFELLHGFTYGVFWAACTTFASANAPSGMTTTLQAVISAFHVGVGKGVGTVLGGIVYQEWGSRTLFRAFLFLCLGTIVVYFLLRRFLVDGVEGPMAVYRKFSLVKGEPTTTDLSGRDEPDNDGGSSSQHMQLTMTTINQSHPDSPPVTKTYHTHRPLLHMQLPNTPDSPDDDDNTSPGCSSLSKLLTMEDRLPALGQEVLEMREGRPPVVGEESDERCEDRSNKGKQTMV